MLARGMNGDHVAAVVADRSADCSMARGRVVPQFSREIGPFWTTAGLKISGECRHSAASRLQSKSQPASYRIADQHHLAVQRRDLIGERDWRHIQLVAPQKAQVILLTDVNTNCRETSLMVGIGRVEELNLVGSSKRQIVDNMAAGEHA